MGTCC